jgi:hypothetical protein
MLLLSSTGWSTRSGSYAEACALYEQTEAPVALVQAAGGSYEVFHGPECQLHECLHRAIRVRHAQIEGDGTTVVVCGKVSQ